MKSLRHNGIYIPVVPRYDLAVTIDNKKVTLSLKQEQMAMSWAKKLGTPYVEDEIFRKNFFKDFCNSLGIDHTETIDFSEFSLLIDKERSEREALSKTAKKATVLARKVIREKRRDEYGTAIVDGNKVDISNYIAEPSCIFMGRGKHPLRGSWKEGPIQNEITLNLSPKAPRLKGWKALVWKPGKMWVASWADKLSGKRKYVWLADDWGKKQEKEKSKFDKALKLEKNLRNVRNLILNNLSHEDKHIRKVASVCYLILKTNIRVGDEKDEDEADTIGAITIRPEHVTIRGRFSKARSHGYDLSLHFLGKDSVEFTKTLITADRRFVFNLKDFEKKGHAYFEGVTSKDVSKFLRKAQDGMTAKVFRTFRATEAVRDALKIGRGLFYKPEHFTEKVKKLHIKFCILEGSRTCNHKKALPKNFEERLAKKKDKVSRYIEKQAEMANGSRKGDREKLKDQVAVATLECEFFKQTSEWNLNTTLKSYIDPRLMKIACDKAELPYDKIYSKALLKKFSWCLN